MLYGQDKILGFQGEYRWLSNFWPCEIYAFGNQYECVETAYVAHKTLDPDIQKELVGMKPGQAKRFGRTLDVRPDFDDIKIDVMRELSKQKYSINNILLREKLLSTGDAYIEETNTWGDTFWGVCNGKGQNVLGNILMSIREDIRNSRFLQ